MDAHLSLNRNYWDLANSIYIFLNHTHIINMLYNTDTDTYIQYIIQHIYIFLEYLHTFFLFLLIVGTYFTIQHTMYTTWHHEIQYIW